MPSLLEKYEINEQQTIKAAESALQQYRAFKTACTLRSHNNAGANIERKVSYIQIIEEAVEHLGNDDERYLLKKVYMGREKIKWLPACDQLYLNKTDYYKLRKKALLSLSINLNIEVYQT